MNGVPEPIAKAMRDNGYACIRALPDGRVIGVMTFIYTAGLCVECDEVQYQYRYCYERYGEAVLAAQAWNGEGDPPGPWVKLKGHPAGERLGPGALNEEEA